MLPAVPMTSASVLVALAMIAGVPQSSSVGKVSNVPPPAMALIAPAAVAEATRARISRPDMRPGTLGKIRARASRAAVKMLVHEKHEAAPPQPLTFDRGYR